MNETLSKQTFECHIDIMDEIKREVVPRVSQLSPKCLGGHMHA